MDVLTELNINPSDLNPEQRKRLKAIQDDLKRKKRLREGNRSKGLKMREHLKSCQAKHQLGSGC